MVTNEHTIGLSALLDEIDADLSDYRKRNPGDYSIRTIVLWWSLEKERVALRHAPGTMVKALRKAHKTRWMLVLFAAGLIAQTALRLIELGLRRQGCRRRCP